MDQSERFFLRPSMRRGQMAHIGKMWHKGTGAGTQPPFARADGRIATAQAHVANFGICAGDAASGFSQATARMLSTSQAPDPDVEQSPVTPAGADNCNNA